MTTGTRRTLRTTLLAVGLGAVVGVGAALYLALVQVVEHLLWSEGRARLPLEPWVGTIVLCTVGGLLVGLLRRRHDADSPHDLDDALLGLDRTVAGLDASDGPEPDAPTPDPPPKVRWLLRAGLLGVVSLGFGASLGPEAPLIVLASGFGRRIAHILRANESEAAYIGAAGALSGMFGGPLGAAVLPVEGSRDARSGVSLLPYGILASLAGLAAMLLVAPGELGLRYDLPGEAGSEADALAPLAQLAWAAGAALPAAGVGVLLLALLRPARRLAEGRIASPVARAVVGGVVLGLCGAVTPLALFSGEHQAQELLDRASGLSVLALLAIAALKLVATLACLSTGWFGGQIFPAIFSGMAVGLVLAAALPTAPVGAVAAGAAAATCTSVLRRPLASVLILLVFFPASVLLPLVTGAAVAAAITRALGEHAPAPPPAAH